MRTRIFTAIAAAAALTATPVMAQSIDAERAAAPVQESEQFGDDNNGGFIMALLALAVIIAGIVIALDGEDDETLPTSP